LIHHPLVERRSAYVFKVMGSKVSVTETFAGGGIQIRSLTIGDCLFPFIVDFFAALSTGGLTDNLYILIYTFTT